MLTPEEEDRAVLVARLLANVRDSAPPSGPNPYKEPTENMTQETQESKRHFYSDRADQKPSVGRPQNYMDICRILSNSHSILEFNKSDIPR